MKKRKDIILSIALLIIILLSFVLFFGIGNVEKNEIQISSFVFVIVTELIVYTNALLIVNKKLNTFLIAGLCGTTFLYTICSFLFNALLNGVFSTIRGILVFNFSLLLLYLIICTIIILFKKEK